MKKFGKWLKTIFSKCTYATERAYETQREQREHHGDHLPPLPPPPPPPQYDLPGLLDTDSDDDNDDEEQGCDMGWQDTLAEYSQG